MTQEKNFYFLLINKYRWLIGILLMGAALLVFYLFSLQVKRERFKQINFDVTVRLQDKIPARFDEIFEDLSFFVSPVLSVILIGLLTTAAAIDFKKKRIRWRAIVIPLAFAALVGVEIYGKDRVESPAPPYFMIKNPITIFPKYHVIDQYSYPSGHAGRALYIGGVSAMLFGGFFYRKFGPKGLIGLISPIGMIILVISIGKVYLGQHWFSDIIGGWILATAFLSLLFGTWYLTKQ